MLRSLLSGKSTQQLTRCIKFNDNNVNTLRPFTTFNHLRNNNNNSKQIGSLFGDVTENVDDENSRLNQMTSRAMSDEQNDLTKMSDQQLAQRDPEMLKLTKPEAQTAPELYLSPLKQRLYSIALKTGGYDPNKVYELDGKKYKLKLSREELQVLEPSLYIKSYRIKGSPKKATPFLRMLREMPLKEALTQCHFSSKRMARDVGEMLNRGIKDAQKLGMNPDELYLSQIWVGKDGGNYKRLEFKARGRVGVIEHKFIHVRAIVKPKVVKDKFLEAKRAREMNRPVKHPLRSRPIHVADEVQEYKW